MTDIPSNLRVDPHCQESGGWPVYRGERHIATFSDEGDAREYARRAVETSCEPHPLKQRVDGIVSAMRSVLGRQPPYYCNEIRLPAEGAEALLSYIADLQQFHDWALPQITNPPSPAETTAEDAQRMRDRVRDSMEAIRYRFWRKHYSNRFTICLGPKGLEGAKFPATRPEVEALGPDYEALIDRALDAAMERTSALKSSCESSGKIAKEPQ